MRAGNAMRRLGIGAAALVMFGMSAGLTATPAWAVERDEFKNECDAGGGKFSEKTETVYCDHAITSGPDKGKTITVFCSTKSNVCGSSVNAPAPNTLPLTPLEPVETLTPIAPPHGSWPRRP